MLLVVEDNGPGISVEAQNEKDESLVYALLDFYPVGLGTLIEKSPYGLVEILPVLERLEQKGFIQETIPNYYIKTI